mmetsp:Transcript_31015/g.73086  ORF Transcript_31015/g.73086 Transcript_31015/m.73086 type:complete len:298 (+) Transcript_31015:108-1001(+)
MTIFLIFITFLAVACSNACNALQILPFERTRNSFASISIGPIRPAFFELQANQVEQMVTEIDTNNKKEEATLTLQGKMSIASNELRKTSLEDVSAFFRAQEYRDLLVTGGGERPCTEVRATPEKLGNWKSQCAVLGACEPTENDSILSVVTGGVQFPGLKVSSSSLIGVKYIEMERQSPRYEFVLISDEQTVSGLPPAVWIFRKLTGADDNGSGDNSKAKSLTTVTFEEKDNGNVVFRTEGFLSIDISFPKILLKILPGDKKTIEEKGGKSIVKALDRDVMQSMKALEKAYLEKFGF